MKLLSWPTRRTTVPNTMDKIVWKGSSYHGRYESVQIEYVDKTLFIDGELFVYTLSRIFVPFRIVLLVIPFPLSTRYALPFFDEVSTDLESFIEREWYIVLAISPTITTNNESPLVWQDNNS